MQSASNDRSAIKPKPSGGQGTASDASAAANAAITYAKAQGGAIIVSRGTYTMNGGSINGTSAAKGGAVYVASGATFILKGGTIANCNAESGGAIYVQAGGHVILDNATIASCNATATHGGAVYLEANATLSISGGEISHCSAASSGGAIYVPVSSNFNISKVTIDYCTSKNYGGAIYSYGNFSCSSCNISNCTSNQGGAIYGQNFGVYQSTIQYCDASDMGGGICVYDEGSVSIEHTTIKNCTATNYGGGIHCDEFNMSVALNYVDITDCTCSESGGGLNCYGYNTVALSWCNILRNSAKHGGGVCFDRASASLIDTEINYNSSTNVGGGLYSTSSTISIYSNDKYCTVSNNTSVYAGGGIYMSYNSMLQSNNLQVLNNVVDIAGYEDTAPIANSACGGGIFCDDSTINIKSGKVEANKINADKATKCYVYAKGGGIYSKSSKLILEKVDITANICNGGWTVNGLAGGYSGGSICFSAGGYAIILGGKIGNSVNNGEDGGREELDIVHTEVGTYIPPTTLIPESVWDSWGLGTWDYEPALKQ